ncbi:MAG TPA: helix-turn-helix domain-containing protein [Polyangia bacterium]|jgi:transcriptional regulator GlxA family with amidase domain
MAATALLRTPSPASHPALIDVTVVLLERALPSSSVAPIEIFGSAGVLWQTIHGQPRAPRFRVRTVSLDGLPTRHAVPLKLRPDGAFTSVRHTDLIVVPTAEFDMDASSRANAPLIPWLRRWHARGAGIAGVCTGVSLLADAGLLDGRPATTHWAMVEAFRRRYPRVDWQPERFVTESGRIFCGGGVYSAIDLSLYLVEKYCGHEVAVETAKALLLETPRIWQSGYGTAPPRSGHDDDGIQKAQAWLMRNFRQEVQVVDLAAGVGMSPRTFARRFTAAAGETPLAYLHRMRIDAAKRLLETRTKSIADVSRAVGYEDVSFFRTLFKRYTGAPPRAYRSRFGPTG